MASSRVEKQLRVWNNQKAVIVGDQQKAAIIGDVLATWCAVW
ncbi:hypothetical protein [Lacticaseibacillus casei]|nr:hypothetical protein [Lacticaseibacillus casei]